MSTNDTYRKTIQTRQIKAIKWAISIFLPSLLIFGFNQVLVSWNLDRLVSAVEESEVSMQLYFDAYRENQPKPGEPNQYWFEHGYDVDYVSLEDQWVRKTVAPAALKYRDVLLSNKAEIESLKILTFDSGVKQARKEYLLHVQAWINLLDQTSSCENYTCVLDYRDWSSASISQTFRSSSTEFSRISPMFDFFDIGNRVTKIFEN
jgi:hypothetical protein